MCGISGILSSKTLNESHKKRIHNMASIQHHRGPDSTGYAEFENVLFAHNRLSLIDLHERSNQPYRNANYVLIYNGEIYNYQILKEELIGERIEFSGTSDTEVLFQALINWGIDKTLARIKGMFAFAFYDMASAKVYLVRDKIGIKPLFYRISNDELCFASELKAITGTIDGLNINGKRLMQASLGAFENSRKFTGFEGIYQLEPGNYICFSLDGNIKTINYFKTADWIDENEYQRLSRMSTEEVDEEFEHLFSESVKSILVADAGMGAFVSGGIDSSLNAAIARKFRPINLYSANVKGKFSEYEEAKLLAKHLGAPILPYDFTPEMFIRDWVGTTWHYDAPVVVHPSSAPFQNVAALTRANGDKAVITGEGSDELFLGYPRLLTKRYDHLIRLPQTVITKFYKRIPGLTRYLNLNHSDYFGDAGKMSFDYERALKDKSYEHPFSFLKGSKTYREQLMTPSMIDNGLHSLLWRNDRMGMMHSIESRFPFLDDDVMKFGVNLPVKFKIGRSTRFHNWKHPFLIDKAIVRRLGAKYLPEKLVYKKKDGFPMYGQMYMKIDEGFLQNGFWQQELEMSSKGISYMCETIEPYLLAKLASVEIWGRLFSWKQSIAEVEAHVIKYSRMNLPSSL